MYFKSSLAARINHQLSMNIKWIAFVVCFFRRARETSEQKKNNVVFFGGSIISFSFLKCSSTKYINFNTRQTREAGQGIRILITESIIFFFQVT